MLAFDDQTFEGINFSKLPQKLRVQVQGLISELGTSQILTTEERQCIILEIEMSLKLFDFGLIGVRLICCETSHHWLTTFNKHKRLLGLSENFIQYEKKRCWLMLDGHQIDENQTQSVFNFGLFLRLIKYNYGEKMTPLS